MRDETPGVGEYNLDKKMKAKSVKRAAEGFVGIGAGLKGVLKK